TGRVMPGYLVVGVVMVPGRTAGWPVIPGATMRICGATRSDVPVEPVVGARGTAIAVAPRVMRDSARSRLVAMRAANAWRCRRSIDAPSTAAIAPGPRVCAW